jgi:hypothetical protein
MGRVKELDDYGDMMFVRVNDSLDNGLNDRRN